jgi:hypothetical protein
LKSDIIFAIKIVFLFRPIFSLAVFMWAKSLLSYKNDPCVQNMEPGAWVWGWKWFRRELAGLGVRLVSTQSPWG